MVGTSNQSDPGMDIEFSSGDGHRYGSMLFLNGFLEESSTNPWRFVAEHNRSSWFSIVGMEQFVLNNM